MGNNDYEHRKEQQRKKSSIKWGKIFNVGVIACILTIICYLTKVQIPGPIESTVKHFSNLTAPLSMMVIGAFMTAMLAQEYNGNYELASKGVALSTLLTVVTMPLLSVVLGV